MKRHAWIAVFCFAATASVWAGPLTVTYQGSLQAPDGQPIADANYTMRFSIFDAANAGSQLWTETDTMVNVKNGLFSTILGDGANLEGVCNGGADLWLEVAVDINRNGTIEANEVYSPRQSMAGAPWAVDALKLGGTMATGFQRRVTGTAPAGQFVTGINADGSVVSAPGGAGDITGVTAGLGLGGGGLSGDVTLAVTSGGITNSMIRDAAVDEFKVKLLTAGTGNATTWTSIARRYIYTADELTSARVLLVTNGESRGGAGEIRVLRGGIPISTTTITGTGVRPGVRITAGFSIAPSDTVDVQYKATSSANPMIFREISLVYGNPVNRNGDTMTGPLTIAAPGTVTHLDLAVGDLAGVDDLYFSGSASPHVYLEGAPVIDAGPISYQTSQTFYLNLTFSEMVSNDETADDKVIRHWGNGYSFISTGAAPFLADIRAGVHLPQGAKITEVRAWVRDNDAAGAVTIYLFRYPNGGTPETMVQVASTGADAAIRQVADTSVLSPIINNIQYHYVAIVTMSASAVGDNVAFCNMRIRYEMPRVAW